MLFSIHYVIDDQLLDPIASAFVPIQNIIARESAAARNGAYTTADFSGKGLYFGEGDLPALSLESVDNLFQWNRHGLRADPPDIYPFGVPYAANSPAGEFRPFPNASESDFSIGPVITILGLRARSGKRTMAMA